VEEGIFGFSNNFGGVAERVTHPFMPGFMPGFHVFFCLLPEGGPSMAGQD
jgi:hypothetical protein